MKWMRSGKSSKRERLVESLPEWCVTSEQVDAEELCVADVVLAGPESRNGYRYSERALREAVPLYEGRPVFLDHAVNANRPYERSTRDLVGSVQNARFAEGKIRSEIRVLDTESGRMFLALAASETANVGMSHVVIASRNKDKTVVERIDEVISVDAVAFPATTRTLREQHREESVMAPGSYEAVQTGIDEVLAAEGSERVAVWDGYVAIRSEDVAEGMYAICEWWEAEDGSFEVSEVVLEIGEDELTSGEWWSRLDGEGEVEEEQIRRSGSARRRLRGRRSATGVGPMLERMRLPAGVVTEEFRRCLGAVRDPRVREQLISERKRFVSLGPVSCGRGSGGGVSVDREFVRVVRGG
ncbi:hypothetical protein [Rubinisphaera margarita]|uniref:hypothetical protein n=1 Tax=Rubinisphaera margarita TaxID=2909586 RepID=UPI001EE7B3E9|nr:hypothetical protein [Rubinisphaera margarita]MCG6154892.1 hypothetical protein [Rubinisphaera margarita]